MKWRKFKDRDKLEKHEMECQECCSSFLNPEPLTWRTVVKHRQLNKKQEGDEWEMFINGLEMRLFLMLVFYTAVCIQYLYALFTWVKVIQTWCLDIKPFFNIIKVKWKYIKTHMEKIMIKAKKMKYIFIKITLLNNNSVLILSIV